MPVCRIPARCVAPLLATILLVLTLSPAVLAQSQEPKPTQPATPVAEPDAPTLELPETGVSGTTWAGPNWGVSAEWDPNVWTVEGELIDVGYDGLQIGTPDSTVFIEAYEGFAGDADACLADAEREINERESVSEVVTLPDRTLPDVGPQRGRARLFGIVAALPDGASYRGIEYVECRTIVPGTAVLELTWQAPTPRFNDELSLVGALFTALVLPGDEPGEMPALPAAPPLTEPNTVWSASRVAA